MGFKLTWIKDGFRLSCGPQFPPLERGGIELRSFGRATRIWIDKVMNFCLLKAVNRLLLNLSSLWFQQSLEIETEVKIYSGDGLSIATVKAEL